MAQNFTTDVTQWQSVDDMPIAVDENIVKSKGVAKVVGELVRQAKAKVKLENGVNITDITTGGVWNLNGEYITTSSSLGYQKVAIDHTKAYQLHIEITAWSPNVSTLVFFDQNDKVIYYNGVYEAIDDILLFPSFVKAFALCGIPSMFTIFKGDLGSVEQIIDIVNGVMRINGSDTTIKAVSLTNNANTGHAELTIGTTVHSIVAVSEIKKWSLLSPTSLGQVLDSPKIKYLKTGIRLFKAKAKIYDAYAYVECLNVFSSGVVVYDDSLNLIKEVVIPKSGLYSLGIDIEAGYYVGVIGYQNIDGVYIGANDQNVVENGGEEWQSALYSDDDYSQVTLDATKYSVKIGLYVGNGRGLISQIAEDENKSGMLNEFSCGCTDMYPSGETRFPSSQVYTYILYAEYDMPNPLLYVHLGGTLPSSKLNIYRATGGTYTRIYQQTLVTGIHNGEKINFPIKKGDLIGVYGAVSPNTGGIGFFYSASTPCYTVAGTDLDAFDALDITTTNNGWTFKFGIKNQAITDVVSDVKEQIKEINPQYVGTFERVGDLRTTQFNSTTLPDGWTNDGYTLTSNGATPNDENALLEVIQNSDFDASSVTAIIDATTAFQVFLVRYQKQYPTIGGKIVEFDMVNQKINLYAGTVKGVTPTTIIKSFDIPFEFVAGQYVLTIGNYAEIDRFSIFGAGEIAEFYVDGRTIVDGYIRPHDDYGIMHKSGTYAVRQISFSCPMAIKPDVLVVGDSIAEADTIRLIPDGGYENRWSGLLAKKTLVSIWAQGGNNSYNIEVDRSFLASIFKPKKVIYAIITNDTDFNNWLGRCQSFTQSFEAIGAEVIYTTTVLRTNSQHPEYWEQQQMMNNWIRNSGHRYIDFLAATTVDGLGETRKAGYFLSDDLHPTPLGHKAMYEAVINSLPDLLSY